MARVKTANGDDCGLVTEVQVCNAQRCAGKLDVSATCSMFGGGHAYTFDRRGYDLHSSGEFVMLHTNRGAEDIHLQRVRYRRLGYLTGVAFRSRNESVSLQLLSPQLGGGGTDGEKRNGGVLVCFCLSLWCAVSALPPPFCVPSALTCAVCDVSLQ